MLHENGELANKIDELERQLQRSNKELAGLQEIRTASRSNASGRVTSVIPKRKVDRRTNIIVHAQHAFHFGGQVSADLIEKGRHDNGTYHWLSEIRDRSEMPIVDSVAADSSSSQNLESMLSCEDESMRRGSLDLQLPGRVKLGCSGTSSTKSLFQRGNSAPCGHGASTQSQRRDQHPFEANFEPEAESNHLQDSNWQHASAFRLQETSTGQSAPAKTFTSFGMSLAHAQPMLADRNLSSRNLEETLPEVHFTEQQDSRDLRELHSPDRMFAEAGARDHSFDALESMEAQLEPAQEQALLDNRQVQDPQPTKDKRKHATLAEENEGVNKPKPKKRATNSRNATIAPTALAIRIQPEREASKNSRIKSQLALGGGNQQSGDTAPKAHASKRKPDNKDQATRTKTKAHKGSKRKAKPASESLSFVQPGAG